MAAQEAASSSTRSDEGPTTSNPSGGDGRSPPFLYCMNIVRTKHDASARRGAVVKALAVCSPLPFVQVGAATRHHLPRPDTTASLIRAVLR